MKTDINYKMTSLINNLKKNEKQIISDENRNLRHLEKVEHMQRTLAEDF
jgi:DNA-directed RNA polymerase subunit F